MIGVNFGAFVVTDHRMEGLPGWPRWHTKLVGLVRFAFEHPFYVGRFRAKAFPRWWRTLINGSFVREDA